jgi:hypothetical protein
MSAEPRPLVPDLILEQYRLGELPVEERDRVETLLRADRALRARLNGLEESDRAIASQFPSERLARQVRARMRARGRHARSHGIRRIVLISALTGGMALVWFALPSDMPDGRVRVKGSPALSLYRRTGSGSETLADGVVAHTGDLLRLGYVSAGHGYGVILSIDGRGVVTLHLPPNSSTTAAALRGGGTILLDSAYELDDAPAWERFYFVTADQPFEVAPIVAAARQAAQDLRAPPRALPVSRELTQSTFLVRKLVQKEVTP